MFFFLACTSIESIPFTQDIRTEKTEVLVSSKPISLSSPVPEFPQKGVVLERGFSERVHCEQKFSACMQRTDDLLYYPQYRVEKKKIDKDLQAKMKGKTWRKGCPIPLRDLSLVRFTHWNQQAGVQWGELIVAEEEAGAIADIFADVYAIYFPMTSVKLMHEFNGSDDASMKANNTSAFNCRNIKRTKRFSEHSYGKAIDVNPLWNPWVKGKYIDPPEGKAYLDREQDVPGLITNDHSIVKIFARHGWKWGGYWKKQKDYQHFSVSGR